MREPNLVKGTDLALYERTASESAAVVIRRYSTSFALASRLLPARMRVHIARIYALVRVADEVVDGPGAAAGLGADDLRALVIDLEAETLTAIDRGFSTNLIVHAFAATAREFGIGAELVCPFFDSMRSDAARASLDAAGLESYIHGSAEVVGLMCLAVFENGRTRTRDQQRTLQEGARRLGAAFQKINFLRDIAVDRAELGRDYLPRADGALTEESKAAHVADIRADLAAADRAMPLLGADCRPAVRASRDLFGELTERIARTPASVVASERVRVPNRVKARILARALVGRRAR